MAVTRLTGNRVGMEEGMSNLLLNDTILALGKGQIPTEFSVDALREVKHFDGFVMKMVEKFSNGEVTTASDQCAILANMFQAGINVGIAYERQRLMPHNTVQL